MTWTGVYMITMLLINIALVVLLCSETNTRDRLVKMYKEEIDLLKKQVSILDQIKSNSEIIEAGLTHKVMRRDQWLNSLIIELISTMTAVSPDINEEKLDEKVYQLVKEAGITDDWLKENEWWVEDDESTDV